MSMPLFPIARTWTRRLALLAFALLPTSALFAQTAGRPLPTIHAFFAGNALATSNTIAAGNTFIREEPLTCGAQGTADLSVRVEPAAFSATVTPTRLSTGETFRIEAPIPLTTPAGDYRLIVTADPVGGDCGRGELVVPLTVRAPARLELNDAVQEGFAGDTVLYVVRVRGSSRGPVQLRIDPTITANEGLPADLQVTIAPNPTIDSLATIAITAPFGSTSCLGVEGCAFTVRGMASVQVEAIRGRFRLLRRVTVKAFPPSRTIAPGDTTTFAIQLERSGFNGPVQVTSESLLGAGGSVVDFEPQGAITGNEVTARVFIPREFPANYRFRFSPLLIGPADGVMRQAAEVDVDATSQVPVQFELAPGQQTVAAGQAVDYSVALAPAGTPQSVRVLGLEGLPPSAGSFQVDRLTNPTRLRIQTLPTAPRQTYSLNLVGEYDQPDGSKVPVRSRTSVDLIVQDPTTNTVSLRVTPIVSSVLPGNTASYRVDVVKTGDIDAVTYSTIGSLPLGARPNARLGTRLDPTFLLEIATDARTTSGTQQLTLEANYLDGEEELDVTSNAFPLTLQTPLEPRLTINGSGLGQRFAAGGMVTFENLSVMRDRPYVGTLALTSSLAPQEGQSTSHIQVSFQPDSVISFSSDGPDSRPFSVRVETGPLAAPGRYTVNLAGTADPRATVLPGTVQFTIEDPTEPTVEVPLGIDPQSRTVDAGQAASYQILINRGTQTGAVQLSATGLAPGVSASFFPNPATGASSTLTLVTSTATPAGSRTFTVGGTSSSFGVTPGSGNLTVNAAPSQAPRIDSFSPTSGGAATNVTLTGANLEGTFAVSFGTPTFGFEPIIDFGPVAANSVEVRIPAGRPSGFFRLSTPAGTTTSAMAFQVTTPNLPEIGGFDPISGPAETRVEIVGSNLGTATGVTFNGTPANFEPPQANRIFARVPAGATTGQIRVTTPAGTATSFASFAVTSGGPVITGFQPLSGSPGDSVTLAGVNLTGAFAVTFNGTPGTVGIVTANFVQVFVPTGATNGKIVLTTPAGPATSPTDFLVLP